MLEDRYEIAGWVTVASAALMIVGGVLGVFVSLIGASFSLINPILVVMTILQIGCSVYGFLWFKRLLNNRFDFHDVDTLIILLIVGGILLGIIGMVFRSFVGVNFDEHLSRQEALAIVLPGLIAMVSVGVPMGVFGIMFGVRLLRLKDPLFGYLKPLAYIQIVGSSLMLTFILAPVGGLVLLAGEILQAMILLGSAKHAPEPEFV
jgi:hypothetical protein